MVCLLMKKKNEYVVALIPARAGSKGIKNKNIKVMRKVIMIL